MAMRVTAAVIRRASMTMDLREKIEACLKKWRMKTMSQLKMKRRSREKKRMLMVMKAVRKFRRKGLLKRSRLP